MFTEDLAPFFADFGVDATLNAAPVRVIFDKAYAGALTGLVESSGPQCVAQSAHVSTAVHGSAMVINGTAYTVTGVEPDGTGITTLQLRA